MHISKWLAHLTDPIWVSLGPSEKKKLIVFYYHIVYSCNFHVSQSTQCIPCLWWHDGVLLIMKIQWNIYCIGIQASMHVRFLPKLGTKFNYMPLYTCAPTLWRADVPGISPLIFAQQLITERGTGFCEFVQLSACLPWHWPLRCNYSLRMLWCVCVWNYQSGLKKALQWSKK